VVTTQFLVATAGKSLGGYSEEGGDQMMNKSVHRFLGGRCNTNIADDSPKNSSKYIRLIYTIFSFLCHPFNY
jgi:hypothetical protein